MVLVLVYFVLDDLSMMYSIIVLWKYHYFFSLVLSAELLEHSTFTHHLKSYFIVKGKKCFQFEIKTS